MTRIGLEGERYLNDFTIAGAIGQQGGDVDSTLYAGLDLRWYSNDNFMLEVGGLHNDSTSALRLGAEFQPGESGLTLFVDAATGNNGFDYLLLGARWYFGESKSLKRRHREDDPVNAVMTGLNSGLQSLVDQARRVSESQATQVVTPINNAGPR